MLLPASTRLQSASHPVLVLLQDGPIPACVREPQPLVQCEWRAPTQLRGQEAAGRRAWGLTAARGSRRGRRAGG